MAATNISDEKSRKDYERDIKDIRAGLDPNRRRRRKKLIVTIAAGSVVVMIAGAGGAWFVPGSGDVEAVAEVAPAAVPVVEMPRALSYVDLKPIFVPVESDAGKVENVVVSLSLEIKGGDKERKRVVQALPRLYEAYLRALTERPLPGAAEGKVEVIHVKNRIRAENLRLLGPGVVHDVILNSIWDPNI